MSPPKPDLVGTHAGIRLHGGAGWVRNQHVQVQVPRVLRCFESGSRKMLDNPKP